MDVNVQGQDAGPGIAELHGAPVGAVEFVPRKLVCAEIRAALAAFRQKLGPEAHLT